MTIHFNANLLPQCPTPEYVAWIDVMGIQSSMSRSLNVSGNFIFKLHIAALQAPHANVNLYPIMDGLYATSVTQQDMLTFLRDLFTSIADEFIDAARPEFRFIVRGAIAYGPVIHGNSVPANISYSQEFQNNQLYKDAILLGLPMIQANQSEKNAPPFGLFVHESARSFSPQNQAPLHHVWWKWGTQQNQAWTGLKQALPLHFAWCKQHSSEILYDPVRIAVHEEMSTQYFA